MKKKYPIFSNILFMIKMAFKNVKSLFVVLFLILFAKILKGVLELNFTPQILNRLEEGTDLKSILILAGVFSILFFLADSIITSFEYIRMLRTAVVRMSLLQLINEKFFSCSYALSIDNKFKKIFNESRNKHTNPQTYSELIWTDLIDLFVNIIMSIYCLYLLTKLPFVLIVMTVAFCFISFAINSKFLDWEYMNRKELSDLDTRLDYITQVSTNHTNGKDIRMFGLANWFNDIYMSTLKAYRNFKKRAKKKVFIGSTIDVVITILRNALTYYYLYRLIVNGRLSASEFVLLFAAQARFSADMANLFEGLKKIKLHMNDLSIIREFIDYDDVIDLDSGIKVMNLNAKDIVIELNNVSYKYEDSEEYILKDINLKINPFEKIAIVGNNGAGDNAIMMIVQ